MKNRNLLTFLFLIVVTIGYSQTQKNDLRIGGYSLISITPVVGTLTSTSIQIRPEASYFLTQNWMLKSQLVLVGSHFSGNFSHGIGFGLGGTYYFGSSKWQPFAGGIVYYGYNSFGYNHVDYTLDMGISYFIKENIALEFVIPVTYIQNVSIDIPATMLKSALIIRPALGIQVYLRKKE